MPLSTGVCIMPHMYSSYGCTRMICVEQLSWSELACSAETARHLPDHGDGATVLPAAVASWDILLTYTELGCMTAEVLLPVQAGVGGTRMSVSSMDTCNEARQNVNLLLLQADAAPGGCQCPEWISYAMS